MPGSIGTPPLPEPLLNFGFKCVPVCLPTERDHILLTGILQINRTDLDKSLVKVSKYPTGGISSISMRNFDEETLVIDLATSTHPPSNLDLKNNQIKNGGVNFWICRLLHFLQEQED